MSHKYTSCEARCDAHRYQEPTNGANKVDALWRDESGGFLLTTRGMSRLSKTDEELLTRSPVFVLGCSWRCGSTLLQRYLNSTGAIFIWGENRRLAGRLIAATAMIDEWSEIIEREEAALVADKELAWIACLNPLRDRRAALLRGALSEYYIPATVARGVARWGFKEVREDASTALSLLSAFPDARIIFLTRHLSDVLLSSINTGWYDETGGVHRIASTWLRNMESFSAVSDARVLTLKFEDLIANRHVATQRIADLVNVPVERFSVAFLDARVGASDRTHGLGETERDLLAEAKYREALRQAGYEL
jgi:hypothetical protein